MQDHLFISSKSNAKIKETTKLLNNQKRKKSAFFIVEGAREVTLALNSKFKAQTIFICPEISGQTDEYPQVIQVSKEVYNHMAMRKSTEGILGVFEKKPSNLQGNMHNLLVLDNVEKPGNLGAIFRTCDALGIQNVVLTGTKSIDVYHPSIIRASLGAFFTLNIHQLSFEQTVELIESQDLELYTTSAKNAASIYSFKPSKKWALVIGSEENGIGLFWNTYNQKKLTIPMHGKVSSLNVSVATALCLSALLNN